MHGCVTPFIRSVQTANEEEQAMHARSIIQNFLQARCDFIHAKRRNSLALAVQAATTAGLGVVKLGKQLPSNAPLRYRIKACDRLLSNRHLQEERIALYRAMCWHVLSGLRGVGIIVDWSELRADGSLQLLRAAVMVKGRAVTVYEEVHPQQQLCSPKVHRTFMLRLKSILPPGCQAIIITDAGFRATWFHLLDQQGWAWIGRIRNRDMVCKEGQAQWQGCKTWYRMARHSACNLGRFQYARSNPVACRLVTYMKPPQQRHRKTRLGQPCRSAHNNKARSAQVEPWLLAVSHRLTALTAKQVVRAYAGRMQIEQTFRDLKGERLGMGLDSCQTRCAKRMAILLLIGVLASHALWIIGLAMRQHAPSIAYGKRGKTPTLSVLSLALYWLGQPSAPAITSSQLTETYSELRSMIAILI